LLSCLGRLKWQQLVRLKSIYKDGIIDRLLEVRRVESFGRETWRGWGEVEER